MKRILLVFILVLSLLLSGCAGGAATSSPASPTSPEPPPPASSVPPEDSGSVPELPEPEEPDPGPPVHLRVLPADSLPEELTADIRLFRERLAESRHPDEEYFYLYVTDENGEPVANLQCYPGDVNWDHRAYNESMYGYTELDPRLGLSRNSGLLPVPAAKFADKGTPVLALCNADTENWQYERRPVSIQEAEIDDGLLERLLAGDVLQFVWEGEKPIDTLLAAGYGYIEVAVTDSGGQPAADRLVYIHSSSKLVGAPDPSGADIFWMDAPYEPRYTDENGIARFVRVSEFGVDDEGNNLIETGEIVVMPCFGIFDDAQKKGVYIEIPPRPPLRFEVVLD